MDNDNAGVEANPMPEPISTLQQRVDDLFPNDVVTTEQAEARCAIRHLAKQLAFKILETTPPGYYQDRAMVELRSAVVLATTAIIRVGAK